MLSTVLVVLGVVVIVWIVLTGLSYWYWKRVGDWLREPLVLYSRIGVWLLPAWTVRAWITVSWLPRRRLRKRIKELKALEQTARPEIRPEILARLRNEITRLEAIATRRER